VLKTVISSFQVVFTGNFGTSNCGTGFLLDCAQSPASYIIILLFNLQFG